MDQNLCDAKPYVDMRSRDYRACFYAPVSFSLFLIALTFPVSPSKASINDYNLWIKLLFEVLPIDADFEQHLAQCGFSSGHPLLSREAMFDFALHMHDYVLGEKLNKFTMLEFFECLRATDCQITSHSPVSSNQGAIEGGCKRISQKTESVCLVMCMPQTTEHAKQHSDVASAAIAHVTAQRQNENPDASENECGECFVMDPVFLTPEARARVLRFNETTVTNSQSILDRAMRNEQAFCSCLFSVKWFLLHLVASRFPLTNPSAVQCARYHTWLTLFGRIIACFSCRVNLRSNLEQVQYRPEIHLTNRLHFETLIYNLHCTVSKMVGKTETQVTLESNRNFFESLATKTTANHVCHVIVAKLASVSARFYFET